MRVIALTVEIHDIYDEDGNWLSEGFRLLANGHIIHGREAPYNFDMDDAEQWAAEELRKMFDRLESAV